MPALETVENAELGFPNCANFRQIREQLAERGLRFATAEEMGLPPPLDLVSYCNWVNGGVELRCADPDGRDDYYCFLFICK